VRRVSRETLRSNIWIALTVLKPYEKRALGLHIEETRKNVTEDLVRRIMGEPASETVMLKPDMVGSPHSPSIGKWGVDEEHPCPDLPSS
jgi:hypothetical protein